MAEDSLRRLMARIAKGLPIVVIGATAPLVLAGCPFGTSCGDSGEEIIVIASAGASDGGTGDAGAVDCYTLCGSAAAAPAGKSVLSCTDMGATTECRYGYICEGRSPEQTFTAKASAMSSDPRRRWLMRLAVAELASVPAFEELADALRRHGAPEELVERARTSALEEAGHAKIAYRLATRDGAAFTLRVEATRERRSSLREVAIHNAEQGCVREAYAALEAAWIAQSAGDDETRRAFATIAREEAGHAQLSLDIDRWARAALDRDAWPALDEARAEGARALREEIAERELPPGLGLPANDDALALLAMIA